MNILDSNIIIYSASAEFAYLRPLLQDANSVISHITYLEVLGFHQLDKKSKHYFENLLPRLNHIPIEFDIIQQAVTLRQERKMSVGNAIIAATALKYNLTIYTRNISDFERIKSLNVINPMQ